ncbi:hypothetical protein C8J57DRAFT_1214771 [Mycena rebaudengoi]|nr:hypothetical protein C8J57DRAFT_1214771 [Mycena rebaudengoi]
MGSMAVRENGTNGADTGRAQTLEFNLRTSIAAPLATWASDAMPTAAARTDSEIPRYWRDLLLQNVGTGFNNTILVLRPTPTATFLASTFTDAAYAPRGDNYSRRELYPAQIRLKARVLKLPSAADKQTCGDVEQQSLDSIGRQIVLETEISPPVQPVQANSAYSICSIAINDTNAYNLAAEVDVGKIVLTDKHELIELPAYAE